MTTNLWRNLPKLIASFAAQQSHDEDVARATGCAENRDRRVRGQINRSWGTDANGKTLDRSDVQQAMLEKYEVNRQNDPLKFENHYYKTIYEPALTACQKKAVCDAEPAARRARCCAE